MLTMHHHIRHPPIVWRYSHIVQQHLFGRHYRPWRLGGDIRIVTETHFLSEDEVTKQQPVASLDHLPITGII